MAHFPALPVTWELDGTSWNTGPDADGNSLLAQEVRGWNNSSPPRPDVQPRTNAPGGYRGPNYRAPKIVEIRGKAGAATPALRQALADRLEALCPDPDTLYPLTQTELGRTLTMWVELNDEIEVIRRPDGLTLDVSMQLIAVDPVKYTPDNDPVSTPLAADALGGIEWNGSPAASGGIEWNGPPGSPTLTGGLVYESGTGDGGSLVLTNSGTAIAPILFTITPVGSVTNPTLINKVTGQQITYNGVLTEPVVIDTGSGRATIGDINVGGNLSPAEFFGVSPPSTEVLFVAATGDAVLTAVNANAYG